MLPHNNLLILSKRLSSVRRYLYTGVSASHFDFVEHLSDALAHRPTLSDVIKNPGEPYSIGLISNIHLPVQVIMVLSSNHPLKVRIILKKHLGVAVSHRKTRPRWRICLRQSLQDPVPFQVIIASRVLMQVTIYMVSA